MHANGWGNFPNPQNYSGAKDLRARFEATVVRSHIGEKDISAAMVPYRDCKCTIQQRVPEYLGATQKEVLTLYRLEKSGGVENAQSFVAKRLAAATSELRDLIIDAWRASGSFSVGTPPIPLPDIEAGKTNAYDAIKGSD